MQLLLMSLRRCLKDICVPSYRGFQGGICMQLTIKRQTCCLQTGEASRQVPSEDVCICSLKGRRHCLAEVLNFCCICTPHAACDELESTGC